MRESALAIAQIVVAATGAYAFASYVLGHPAPLLAGTVTISSLGLMRDARPRRVLLTVIGMLVGVLVAEVFVTLAGSGWWQLALTLAVTLLVARFLSPFPPFALMAGIQSVIVMALPQGQPFIRLIDAVVGGVAALLVTALIPRNPRREEVRDGRALFRETTATMSALAQALRYGSRSRAERGLEKARAIGPFVECWHESLESGLAVARISPMLRRQRHELQRHDRMRVSMDYATRNLRVLGRLVVARSTDGNPRPAAADLLDDFIVGVDLLGRSLDDAALQPAAREALFAVSARLDPALIMPGASMGDQHLLASMRPLAVDLLTAAGVPPEQAIAAVPRI